MALVIIVVCNQSLSELYIEQLSKESIDPFPKLFTVNSIYKLAFASIGLISFLLGLKAYKIIKNWSVVALCLAIFVMILAFTPLYMYF
nr:hypothetical protein [uncultured Psychroserpens sp.]